MTDLSIEIGTPIQDMIKWPCSVLSHYIAFLSLKREREEKAIREAQRNR